MDVSMEEMLVYVGFNRTRSGWSGSLGAAQRHLSSSDRLKGSSATMGIRRPVLKGVGLLPYTSPSVGADSDASGSRWSVIHVGADFEGWLTSAHSCMNRQVWRSFAPLRCIVRYSGRSYTTSAKDSLAGSVGPHSRCVESQSCPDV